jgi:hypothetical protein
MGLKEREPRQRNLKQLQSPLRTHVVHRRKPAISSQSRETGERRVSGKLLTVGGDSYQQYQTDCGRAVIASHQQHRREVAFVYKTGTKRRSSGRFFRQYQCSRRPTVQMRGSHKHRKKIIDCRDALPQFVLPLETNRLATYNYINHQIGFKRNHANA